MKAAHSAAFFRSFAMNRSTRQPMRAASFSFSTSLRADAKYW